jgi:hypothetical protein
MGPPNQVEIKSNKFKLTKIDCSKLAKGVGVACAGAILTYLSEWAVATDFGEYTPLVVAGMSVFVNFLRKWLTNTDV